jgi:hypothetical protein
VETVVFIMSALNWIFYFAETYVKLSLKKLSGRRMKKSCGITWEIITNA